MPRPTTTTTTTTTTPPTTPPAAPRRTRVAAPPPPPPAFSLRLWWAGLPRWIRFVLTALIALPLVLCLCTLCTSSYYLGLPWVNARLDDANRITQLVRATQQPPIVVQPQPQVQQAQVQPTTAPQPTQAPQPQGIAVPTAAPQPTASAPIKFDTNEALVGTLDDFGRATRYDDRFPPAGMIWDQSYNSGEIFVANAFAIHDQTFKSQNGCVVAYFQAPSGGGRIRFTGFDGMGFELNANSGYTLSQAVAAMRETLTRAHKCDAAKIQYHELVRFGDSVK